MKNVIGRSSCTSILIGKKASLTGSVIIGRNEDAKTAWPKHLAFNPHQDNVKNNHFKSKDNKFEMDLPETIFSYSSTPEWTDKYGVFEEDGINEHHVAMSATESAYANERVLAVDPFDTEKGILEEAMVTVVLPYVKTAREGVQRLGEIVEKHGAAEADGILFSDPDEAWYMEIGSGHHWVAQRIPDDSYAVVANQLAIQAVVFDGNDFMYSKDLKDFVYQNQLWPKDAVFNWREIFGTHDDSDLHYNTPRVWIGQKLLTPSVEQEPQDFDLPFIRKPDKPISIQDAQAVLSNHYQNTPYDLTNPKNKNNATFRPISVATTQESHLLELNGENMIHWLAMGIAAQSVYVPFYPQGTKVPTMYKYGKEIYSTNSAYWVFKLASTLADRDWNKYGTDLSNAQDEAREKTTRLRYEYDQKLAKESDPAKRIDLVNEANEKMAKTATDIFKELSAKLITKQTGDSPLRFKMDPNL